MRLEFSCGDCCCPNCVMADLSNSAEPEVEDARNFGVVVWRLLIQVAVNFGFRDAGGEAVPFFPNFPMAMLFVGILRWLLNGLARYLADHFMLPAAGAAVIVLAFWAVQLRKVKVSSFLRRCCSFVQ